MRPAAIVLAATLVVAACAPSASDPVSGGALLGLNPDAIVAIGPDGVAARFTGSSVEVVVVRRGLTGWVASPVTSHTARLGENSVHLMTYDGATGLVWNTFVYGTGASGVDRVRLLGFPEQVGGRVVDGVWVIALPNKGVVPSDLRWEFVDATGQRLDVGAGIFPPDA